MTVPHGRSGSASGYRAKVDGPRDRSHAANRQVIADAMTPMCAAGSVLFALVSVSQFLSDETPGSWASSSVAALTSVVFAVSWALLRSPAGDVIRRNSLRVGVAWAVIVSLNPLVYIIGTHITYPAIGMLLVIVGVGGLLHDRLWAAIVIVALNLAWIICALVFGIPVAPAEFVAHLVKANALAVVLNVTRNRTFRRLEQAREEVHRLATTDALTGVANQRGFLEVGRSIQEVVARTGGELTVVYVDVDELKSVNDVHGHSAGDALIRQVAETLRGTFRPGDTVARVGGDEFAVLVVGGSEDLGRELVGRIRQRLSEVGISASVGAATSRHGDSPVDLAELLERADAAMYAAKAARRARGQSRVRRAGWVTEEPGADRHQRMGPPAEREREFGT